MVHYKQYFVLSMLAYIQHSCLKIETFYAYTFTYFNYQLLVSLYHFPLVFLLISTTNSSSYILYLTTCNISQFFFFFFLKSSLNQISLCRSMYWNSSRCYLLAIYKCIVAYSLLCWLK